MALIMLCQRMRILLIEDEDSIRTALQRAMQRDGHDVRAAACILDGRSTLGDWTPELVVSDLKLPDGNGLDFAGSIGVPFVMLSGYATFDDAVRALRLGAVDFFTKPVAIKDIRSAIQRGLPRPYAQPDLAWNDSAEAVAVVQGAMSGLPGLLSRLAMAELAQSVNRGRLEVHLDHTGVRLWLDATVDWAAQPLRQQWLRANGVDLVVGGFGAIAKVESEVVCNYDKTSELLWPEELMTGRTIRAQAWRSVGSWFPTALRLGIGPVVGLPELLTAVFRTAGITVPTAPEALAQPGVGGAERRALLGSDELGPPVA